MNNRFFTFICLVFGCIILTGCRSYPVQAIPSLRASETKTKAVIDGTTFAAKEFTDRLEIKAIFNYDLMEKGFLPVLFIVDNQGNQSIELMRPYITFETNSGESLEPVSSDVVSTKFGRNAMSEAFWFFGIFSYDNAIKFNENLQRDWQQKSLSEIQLVRPGAIVRKFLYFFVGKDFSAVGSKLNVVYRLENQPKKSVELIF